jgi:hypothetical protein
LKLTLCAARSRRKCPWFLLDVQAAEAVHNHRRSTKKPNGYCVVSGNVWPELITVRDGALARQHGIRINGAATKYGFQNAVSRRRARTTLGVALDLDSIENQNSASVCKGMAFLPTSRIHRFFSSSAGSLPAKNDAYNFGWPGVRHSPAVLSEPRGWRCTRRLDSLQEFLGADGVIAHRHALAPLPLRQRARVWELI